MKPPTDPDCIFCKIVAGSIPCHRLYEDDDVLAMLDIGPLSPGHALVIPKGHYVTIDTMPAAQAAACGAVLPALVRAIRAATGTVAANVLQNNGRQAHQMVDHVHFHLIPKSAVGGLGIDWPAGDLDAKEAIRLADAIAGHMVRS